MDHVEASEGDSKVRLVGNLHRGALQEIKVDRLINNNEPLHEKLTASWNDVSDRPVKKQVQSEPRPNHNRIRSSSGDIVHPRKLFETEDTFSGSANWFAHGSELRRRRNAFTEDHELLMKSIRRVGKPSPTHSTARNRQFRGKSRWVIPVDSTFKVVWDILTVILSIANSHAMHVSIRERKFGFNAFVLFCNIWFSVDMLLSFVTARRTADGEILRDYRSICARYLTSWFAVDLLALMPWETLYVKPIIDIQNKRGFLQKYFFRSKAVVRVTRHLRGRHFRWFGEVTKRTKQHGVGASRLLRLIIKYIPKYFMFLKNMKGGIVFRILRQFQWFRRFYNNILNADGEKHDFMTGSLTKEDLEEEDDLSSKHSGQKEKSPRVQLVYETWELMNIEDGDDDDDGVPL